jgi:hypothetical protein
MGIARPRQTICGTIKDSWPQRARRTEAYDIHNLLLVVLVHHQRADLRPCGRQVGPVFSNRKYDFSDRYVIQRTPAVSSGINNLLKRISVLALVMPQEQGNVPVDYTSPDQAVGEEQILLHIGSVHRDQSKSVGAHDGGRDIQSDIFHIEEIVSISNKPPAPEETPGMTGRHNGPKCAQPSFTSCSAGISSSVSEDLLPGSTPTRGNAGMTFSNFSQTNKTKEIHAGKEDGLDGDKSDDWSIVVQGSESDK